MKRLLWALTMICLFGPQTWTFVQEVSAERLYVLAEEEDGCLRVGLWREEPTLILPGERVAARVSGPHETWILERSTEGAYRLVRVVGTEHAVATQYWPWLHVTPEPEFTRGDE